MSSPLERDNLILNSDIALNNYLLSKDKMILPQNLTHDFDWLTY